MPTMNDRTFRALRVILDDHFSKEPVGVERLSEAYGMVDLWWDRAQPIADQIAAQEKISAEEERLSFDNMVERTLELLRKDSLTNTPR